MSKKILLKLRKVFTYTPLENILMVFLQGSDYRGSSTKLIPPPEMYESGVVKTVERDGIKYQLDRSCLMQWYIYWGLQDITRSKLYSLVKENDIVFDVGTNVGETLLNFGKLVGRGGFVYGFEPDDRNFNNVQKNIGLNDLKNLHVFNVGVSETKASVKLYRVDPHNLGMNRILSEEESAKFDDYTVIETDTLDNIVAENKIEQVDVIKLDIEGYEMHALRGGIETLRRFRPKLFIEVGYSRLISNGTSPTEMVELLNGIGYVVRHAETDEVIGSDYDFAPLGEGGIDVYAVTE